MMTGFKSKRKAAADKLEMPGTIGGAKLVFPKITKGSHLTVTEYEDGKTVLEWDHEQLQKDVEQAIASYEALPAAGKIAKKSKATHRL